MRLVKFGTSVANFIYWDIPASFSRPLRLRCTPPQKETS
jgi:hypothetical protein